MIVYSASELGGCTKYLVAKRCGYDPIPNYGDNVNAFKLGHVNEAEVLEWLQSTQGYTITETQAECYIPMGKTEDGESIVIQCHPDAIGFDKTGARKAIEIKRANDDAYKDFLRNGWEHAKGLFPRYLYQVSAYHAATGLPVDFVVRNGEYNVDGEPIKTRGGVGKTLMSLDNVAPPLYTLDQLRARVERVERLAAEYDIPRDCDYPNYFCPLSYLHESQVDVEANESIDELAREYDRWRSEIKRAKDSAGAKRLNVRNKILKEMGLDPWAVSGETTRVETPNVKCVAMWGRTSFPHYDYDRMRADGIDLDKYRAGEKYGWRLNVYVRGSKKMEEETSE